MRTAILSLLLAATWPATLLAAPPEIKLTPDKPKPTACDLVTVSADTTAKSIRWKVLGDCQFKPDSSGRSVVIVPKSGRVSVLAIAASDTGELSDFAEFAFLVDPIAPPVKPDPPKPDPVRPTAVKLKAVAVYESMDASVLGEKFFASADLAARWKEKGHSAPVIADKDVKDPETNATPAKLKPYIDRAAGKSLPQLYLIDAATGNVLYEGPLPTTPAAMIELLNKIGG